jgi:hypothetical protein
MNRGQTVTDIAKRTTLSVRKPHTRSSKNLKWMTSRDRKSVKSGFEHVRTWTFRALMAVCIKWAMSCDRKSVESIFEHAKFVDRSKHMLDFHAWNIGEGRVVSKNFFSRIGAFPTALRLRAPFFTLTESGFGPAVSDKSHLNGRIRTWIIGRSVSNLCVSAG